MIDSWDTNWIQLSFQIDKTTAKEEKKWNTNIKAIFYFSDFNVDFKLGCNNQNEQNIKHKSYNESFLSIISNIKFLKNLRF